MDDVKVPWVVQKWADFMFYMDEVLNKAFDAAEEKRRDV